VKRATLELIIKREQVGAASREFDQLGLKGEQTAKRIESAFGATDRAAMKLADSMRRMREQSQSNAMASMITATDPFQKQAKSLTEATEAAGRHSLALGKISNSLEALAVEATGTNSKLASIGGKFLEFGVGGIVTAGVLGGLAAITYGWDLMTASARKAQEELKKQLDLLRDIKREQDLGIEGETGAAVKGGRARLDDLASIINHNQGLIRGGQLQGQSLGFVMAARDRAIKEYTEIAVVVQAGEKRLTEIRDEEAEKRRQKAEQAAQKEKRQWEDFFAELARVRQVERDQTTAVGESIDKKVSLSDIKPRMMQTTGGVADLRISASAIASAANVQARARRETRRRGRPAEASRRGSAEGGAEEYRAQLRARSPRKYGWGRGRVVRRVRCSCLRRGGWSVGSRDRRRVRLRRRRIGIRACGSGSSCTGRANACLARRDHSRSQGAARPARRSRGADQGRVRRSAQGTRGRVSREVQGRGQHARPR
jgi:hypothetical protein